MTLPVKNSPELSGAGKPGASGQNSGQSIRSNPVCLEIGVTLRSLPGEAGGQATPIREEAKTVIVFDNGAVLRSGANLTAGRTLILSNASGRDVVCRVGAGRNLPSIKGYVEVEFIEPVSNFWGVHQDQPRTAPTPQTPSLSADASPSANPQRPASVIEMPAKPPIPNLGASRPFEAPPSSASIAPTQSVREEKPQSPNPSFGFAEKSAYGYSHAELAVPDPIANWTPPEAEKTEAKVAAADLSASGKSVATTARAPGRDFMNHGLMAYEQSGSSSKVAEGRMPLIVGLAALVLASAGGVFFLTHRNAAPTPAAKATVEMQPAVPPAPMAASTSAAAAPQEQTAQSGAPADTQAQPQDQPLQVDALPPAEAPAPIPAVAKDSAAADSRPDSRAARSIGKQTPAKQVAAAPSRPAALASLKMTSPTAPNSTSTNSGDAGSPGAELAPSEAPGTAPPAGLLTSAGRTSKPPLPPPSAVVPPVAGAPAAPKVVHDPKLISSYRAAYPPAAKESNIQGTVTVLANVDENGKIVGAKAIGGPLMLREAAVDSVKQWKYAPGTVDGKPSPAQVTVSVDFRLN